MHKTMTMMDEVEILPFVKIGMRFLRDVCGVCLVE